MSNNTRQNLINYAERLIRTRGYSGFSYADLATKVGIRKASIHHHFAFKEQLGEEIIQNYIDKFTHELKNIESNSLSPQEQLSCYAKKFQASTSEGLLPLCGALAAEFPTLPDSLRTLTTLFFNLQLSWIENKLSAIFASTKITQEELSLYAYLLLSNLEGSTFIDWALGSSEKSPSGFELVLNTIISSKKSVV